MSCTLEEACDKIEGLEHKVQDLDFRLGKLQHLIDEVDKRMPKKMQR